MSNALLTPADVADRLRITESQVLDLRRKHQWPCVTLSRKAIRFTESQVEQIVAQHAERPDHHAEVPAIKGQTKQSQRRRSA